MTVVFATTVDPGELADMTLCEQVFMLLDIGHDPADVDPRALAYHEAGNRGPMVGDAVAVTRPEAKTAHCAVAPLGFTRIDPPSVIDRPGSGTAALT